MTRARRAKAAAPASLPPQPEPQDGLGYGLRIHRYSAPRDWPRELGKVPEEHRPRAEEYLRGIAARMRHLRRLAQAAGFDSVDAWREAQGGR